MGFVERHRAEIIVCIVLPVSFVLWLVDRVRKYCSAPNPRGHAARVFRVAQHVRGVLAARRSGDAAAALSGAGAAPGGGADGRLLLRTDRSPYHSHSVRNSNKAAAQQVPMRDLRAILGVALDPSPPPTHAAAAGDGHPAAATRQVVHVEPGVTVGEVTSFLLRREPPLMLRCTLEMEDATLGGLAMAQGMTTHSHQCGLLSETVVEFEVVSARGDVLIVTAHNDHRELFRALPLSHGTLGLLVSLKLQVVPAKRWVRLRYSLLSSRAALTTRFVGALEMARSRAGGAGASGREGGVPFFLESILFSPQQAVLMEGWLSDGPAATAEAGSKAARVNRIGWWFKPWFFKHVESMLGRAHAGAEGESEFVEELIPIRDYLMRHDRAMCMTMGTLVPYGNHWLFRLLLGWLLPPQLSFLKSSHTQQTREASIRKQCYQDVCLPARCFDEAVSLSDELFGIYPLLVYPCKLYGRSGGASEHGGGMVPVNSQDCDDAGVAMYMNLGIYGIPEALRSGGPEAFFPMVTSVRRLEEWLRSVGGFQHTYCDSFQTEAEFEQMFDHGLYDKMREVYAADSAFPRVYDKTRPEMDVWRWLEEEQERAQAAGVTQ